MSTATDTPRTLMKNYNNAPPTGGNLGPPPTDSHLGETPRTLMRNFPEQTPNKDVPLSQPSNTISSPFGLNQRNVTEKPNSIGELKAALHNRKKEVVNLNDIYRQSTLEIFLNVISRLLSLIILFSLLVISYLVVRPHFLKLVKNLTESKLS